MKTILSKCCRVPSHSEIAVIAHEHQGIFTPDVYRKLRMCRNAQGYADTGYFDILLDVLQIPGHSANLEAILDDLMARKRLMSFKRLLLFYFFKINMQGTKSQGVRISYLPRKAQ